MIQRISTFRTVTERIPFTSHYDGEVKERSIAKQLGELQDKLRQLHQELAACGRRDEQKRIRLRGIRNNTQRQIAFLESRLELERKEDWA